MAHHPSAAAVLCAALLAPLFGCARADLRLAMGHVQRAQVALDDRIRARMTAEIPAAVDRLEGALLDPRIAKSPLHASDDRFAELLSNALAGVGEFRERSPGAGLDDLLVLRGSITQACTGCHDEYRPR